MSDQITIEEKAHLLVGKGKNMNKPTIAELEAILDDPQPRTIRILPSGEITTQHETQSGEADVSCTSWLI